MRNLNEKLEKEALAAGKLHLQIDVPVLAIDSKQDQVTVPGFMDSQIKPFAANLHLRTANRHGHFVQLVAPDEVNQWILAHVEKASK